MYEFRRITFQKQFCAVLQHALFPILEYAAELYGAPPHVFNGKLPSMAGRKLDYKSEKYDIGSEPIMHRILHACADNGGKKKKKKKGKGKGNVKGRELNTTGYLRKATINFYVPTNDDHEFWRKPSLNPTNETFEENSMLLQVFAFASSDQEAQSLALMKLMNFLKLLGEISRQQMETGDMKLMISKLMRKTIRPTFPEINDDAALNIGAQLFNFYLGQEYGTHMRDRVWHSMTTLIIEASKRCSAELQPLLKYYLVNFTYSLFFLFLTPRRIL